ncbi:vasopressin V1a receptor-like [Gigantopelta aegis]|uniref:vasopressin V1a receptor-like n=1 Tax=Gigantopelta aegis TaxID=1735272 RepID=UPI001B88849F|nr:vasopressin V1a receptor-like [Gigantopelta aegis]XP_041376148.1 vasopressin V1a receptor-like [Gigantopelta aegis]
MENVILNNLTWDSSILTPGSGTTPGSDTPAENVFDYIIHVYVYRVIYAVGFLGNIISLLVWIQTKNRAPPICFFIAICIADTLVLITHSIEKHYIYVNYLCQIIHVFFFAVQIFAILLVVGMSVEQYISICRPLKEYKVTHRRIWKAISGLALVAIVAGSLEGYFWALDDDRKICTLRKGVNSLYSWIYGYAVLVCLFIIPVIAIITLNAMVWYAVKKARHKTFAYGRSMRRAKTRFNKTFHFVSLHLAIGELLYAMIHISIYGHYIDGHESEKLSGRWPSYYITSLPFLIADIISLSSYALDITFFTLSSRTFRKAALRIVGCRKQLEQTIVSRFETEDTCFKVVPVPLRVRDQTN